MICPPVFEDETDSRALKRYYSYLCNLQKEYLELLEFCFDETFYPNVLGQRHPAERFYLYRYLHGYPVIMERTETVLITSHFRTGQVMPYGMTTEEVIHRLSNPVPVTDDLRSCTNRLKPFQQSTQSSNDTNSLGRANRNLIIFGKSEGIVEPSQGTFNSPPLRQDLPFGFYVCGNVNIQAQFLGNIPLKGLAVACIGTEPLNRWVFLKGVSRCQNT